MSADDRDNSNNIIIVIIYFSPIVHRTKNF